MVWSRFSELTRLELRDRVDQLVVVPLAATEQHGDHLPVMTDATIVTAIVELAAEAASESVDLVVAPTVTIGLSEHHLAFGGTLSVTAATYVDLLYDFVTALWRQGFERVLFVNGHGGNDSAMRVAVERLALCAVRTQSVAGLSYWHLPSALDAASFPLPGHAGRFETSLMLALHPELVRMELVAEEFDVLPLATNAISGIADSRLADWASSDGRTDGASLADEKTGLEHLGSISSALAAAMRSHVELLDRRTPS